MFIVYDIEDHFNVEGILVHLTWIRVMVYTVALNVGISIEVDSHIRQKSWLKTVSSCPKAMPIQRKVYKKLIETSQKSIETSE